MMRNFYVPEVIYLILRKVSLKSVMVGIIIGIYREFILELKWAVHLYRSYKRLKLLMLKELLNFLL